VLLAYVVFSLAHGTE